MRKFVIQSRTLVLLSIYFVLSLPDSIKSFTSIYGMTTFGLPLTYTYNYFFSILEIPIITLGMLCYKKSKIIRFWKVLFPVVVLNIGYVIFTEYSVVSLNSYEMFLLILTGFSSASLIMYLYRDNLSLEKAIDYLIIINFVFQLLNIITGKSINGRYSTIGMGSGATASINSMFLVWSLFARRNKVNKSILVISIVSILLTGSRTNFFTFGLILLIFSKRLIIKELQMGNASKIVLYCSVLLLFIPISFYFINTNSSELLERITVIFKGNLINNIQRDSSWLGRVRSIEGSITLLKDNFMGLPYSLYAIEEKSAYMFSMEYPHSTVISYLLLWSPLITIPVYVYLILLTIKLFLSHDNSAVFMFYICVIFLVYGDPILYSKMYMFILICISYVLNNHKKYL